MAQVAFATAGAGAEANGVGTLDVPYPASISANDLLVLQVLAGDHDSVFATPSGWSRLPGIAADVNFGTAGTIGETCLAGFYKWASGSESGNLTCTRTSTTDFFAGRMYRFNGFTATGGNPFVGEATNTGTDASVESPATSANATADNDMGLLLAWIGDDNALGNWDEAAESVEWTEATAEFLTLFGNDGGVSINTCATVTSGNAIPANLETMAAADPWYVWVAIVKENAGSGHVTVTPDVGIATLTGAAPTSRVAAVAGNAVAALTGAAPTVAVVAAAGVATLALSGFEATVDSGGDVTVQPDTGTAALSGLAPTVTVTAAAGAATVALTGSAPTVRVAAAPDPATVTLATFAPAVALTAQPAAATSALTGAAATVVYTAQPAPAVLTLATFTPTVTDFAVVVTGFYDQPTPAGGYDHATPAHGFDQPTPAHGFDPPTLGG